jgi:elongation factor Ts
MVEVNCETDFVCKTDEFQKYVKDVAGLVANTKPADLEALLGLNLNGKKIADIQTEMVARIGENIGIRRFVNKKFDGKTVKASLYIHAGSKIGVTVLFEDPSDKLTEIAAKDVAMHIAAMNPSYVRKGDISEAIIAKEKEVFTAQMANEKKPPEILAKIVEGKVSKYLSEICLDDQIFVRDPAGKQTVSQMLKTVDSAIKVKEFVRYQVGEKL